MPCDGKHVRFLPNWHCVARLAADGMLQRVDRLDNVALALQAVPDRLVAVAQRECLYS